MDEFVKLKQEERRVFFEGTASHRNLQPEIVEKDFWVCWVLKELFDLSTIGEHLIFKGGTSLSKVFKVIERFSEDIDISIDRRFLGFGGAEEPEAGGSNKEKQRRIEKLKVACQQKIAEEMLPLLKSTFGSKMRDDETWSLGLDDADPDQQTLLFSYPTSFLPDATGYIRRTVKIEMGARADHWPCETRPITPYVAEQFPRGFQRGSCPVKVLSLERTFWEKATILHAEFHRPGEKATPIRISRHYSDCYELIRRDVARSAESKLDLLARVTAHKSLFFRSSWAKYGEAVRGNLRVAPSEQRVESLREDYHKMAQMFFGDPIGFDEIVGGLKQWEREFNRE